MEFSEIVGKTLESVDNGDGERIVFHFADGTACTSYHSQDCCESVGVDRVEGDIDNILGQPILEAEETMDSEAGQPEFAESWTWTRQRIKTAAGEVTFVWLGTSNGYYGETPYFQITHGKLV
jgi:hypothetical protein